MSTLHSSSRSSSSFLASCIVGGSVGFTARLKNAAPLSPDAKLLAVNLIASQKFVCFRSHLSFRSMSWCRGVLWTSHSLQQAFERLSRGSPGITIQGQGGIRSRQIVSLNKVQANNKCENVCLNIRTWLPTTYTMIQYLGQYCHCLVRGGKFLSLYLHISLVSVLLNSDR